MFKQLSVQTLPFMIECQNQISLKEFRMYDSVWVTLEKKGVRVMDWILYLAAIFLVMFSQI